MLYLEVAIVADAPIAPPVADANPVDSIAPVADAPIGLLLLPIELNAAPVVIADKSTPLPIASSYTVRVLPSLD